MQLGTIIKQHALPQYPVELPLGNLLISLANSRRFYLSSKRTSEKPGEWFFRYEEKIYDKRIIFQ